MITSFTADDGSLYAFFFKLSALNVSSRHRARHDMCVHTNAAYLAHAYIDVCTHERTHARTVHVLCARAQAVCTHAHLVSDDHARTAQGEARSGRASLTRRYQAALALESLRDLV